MTVFGILAHVDAGKTTLSESILSMTGTIRSKGSVDVGTSFLDTDETERSRGITIYSKPAVFSNNGRDFCLLDTPGHSDFFSETKRVLPVLDAAVLIVSAPDGVNSPTITYAKLLKRYRLPFIIFVNKTDQAGFDKSKIMNDLRLKINESCIDMSSDTIAEEIALNSGDEALLEKFLNEGDAAVTEAVRSKLFNERKYYPVILGAALKELGTDKLLETLNLTKAPGSSTDDEPFSGRVFKIIRDDKGMRLSFLKVTSGILRIKDLVRFNPEDKPEKINEIRLYSGQKFKSLNSAEKGMVVAVTGLKSVHAGDVIGESTDKDDLIYMSNFDPILTRSVIPAKGADEKTFLESLDILTDEDPQLCARFNHKTKEATVHLMGRIQAEILTAVFKKRFNIDVSFGSPKIRYRETVKGKAEGVGHYEPLRHYAEVHLLVEEAPLGSGIIIENACTTDTLSTTYQRQILDALRNHELCGVLTGSELNDVKITLLSGKSHVKHTMPGDFCESALRAVRQALMKLECVLQEPFAEFSVTLPQNSVGNVMHEIDMSGGITNTPGSEGSMTLLTGFIPAAFAEEFQSAVRTATYGEGTLSIIPSYCRPCHNADNVIESFSYDPDRDTAHPSGSIFCEHGAGTFVPWDKVEDKMHLPSAYRETPDVFSDMTSNARALGNNNVDGSDPGLHNDRSEKDIISIMDSLSKTGNQKNKPRGRDRHFTDNSNQSNSNHRKSLKNDTPYKGKESSLSGLQDVTETSMLLVDGYNIIFAWDELRSLADENIDAARDKLNDILCNYQGYCGMRLIVVYDAYLIKNHPTEIYRYRNISVVFTKTAETADQYIEKCALKHSGNISVTVATSDRVEQVIVAGANARTLSAESFKTSIDIVNEMISAEKEKLPHQKLNMLFDGTDDSLKTYLEEIRLGNIKPD